MVQSSKQWKIHQHYRQSESATTSPKLKHSLAGTVGYGREFTHFVSGLEELVALGDTVLRNRLGTGYNVLLEEADMSLASTDGLIFYSNYIGRPRHFGLLLSEMEQQNIITPDRVRFGVRASRVLYGGWDIDPEDEVLSTIEREDEQGVVSEHSVSQTVETVVTFSPRDVAGAVRIATALRVRATSQEPGSVAGSWEVPDIRATAALAPILTPLQFVEVTANIFSRGRAQLVVLRQTTLFTQPWDHLPIEVNERLALYLVSADIPV